MLGACAGYARWLSGSRVVAEGRARTKRPRKTARATREKTRRIEWDKCQTVSALCQTVSALCQTVSAQCQTVSAQCRMAACRAVTMAITVPDST